MYYKAAWKFLFVVTCFLFSVINKKTISKNDIFLLRFGMFFTVLADFCLIIINKYLLGVVFFCVVQQIYSLRYVNIKYVKLLFYTLIPIIITLTFIQIDLLIKISIAYTICLSYSVIGGVFILRNKKYPKVNETMIRMGMILFLLCDINVALLNLNINFLDESTLSFLIWFFYLPSQICLTVSGQKFEIIKTTKDNLS